MKKRLPLIIIFVVALLGIFAFVRRGKDQEDPIEYHYAKVEKGEVSQSIQATGALVALTSVDVKSKAGGAVLHLAVDEGDVVKKGQLIATIDPADTQASYDQASADLTSSQAKAKQAQDTYELTKLQAVTAVDDARAALDTAKLKLHRVQIESGRQGTLTDRSIDSAQAAYDEAAAQLNKMKQVTLPQTERDTNGAVLQTKQALDTAKAELKRSEDLLAKGYISQSQVDKNKSAAEDANQAYETALQKKRTLKDDLATSLSAQQATVSRLAAALAQSKAQESDKDIAGESLDEAQKAVRAAEINLQKAIDNRRNVQIREADILAARASSIHDKVSVKNAKVQLDSTTVTSPRDGVVTLKYLEEGTIIPPGTSTFAQGTSLVQVSDISQMFVDCTVDEADIGNVKTGQRVKITAEAFKDVPVEGTVLRISPSAVTANNVTTIKVRVKIKPDPKRTVLLVPGMNATCEFITLSKENVLEVPSQAVTNEDGKNYVQVKNAVTGKPEKREVTIGVSGNDNVEIIDGVKEGEEVVTAAIDLVEAQKLQEKMIDAQSGGGLAGGGNRGGRSFGKTATPKKS